MKRRLLALATALVMIIGLLPATILTVSAVDTPAYVDLQALKDAGGSSLTVLNSADDTENGFNLTNNYTATLTEDTPADASNHDALWIAKLIQGMSEPHLTQTITIRDMPVFESQSHSGDYYKYSGYYTTLQRNRVDTNGGTSWNQADFITYSIYRPDETDNLAMKIYNHTNQEYAQQVVPLNKKLGDEIILTTVWHADNKVTFYCDGESLGTFDNVMYQVKNTYSIDTVFLGYFNHRADYEYAGKVDLTVSNVLVTDGHTPGEHNGICTSPITCTICGAVTTPGKDHTFNQKLATEAYLKEGNTFYTSCSVCGTSSAGQVGEATFAADDISGADVTSGICTNATENKFDISSKYAAILSDTYTYGDYSSSGGVNNHTIMDDVTLKYFFQGKTSVHLTQTIQINDMPAFSSMTVAGNFNQFNGYFNTLHRNQHQDDTIIEGKTITMADYLFYSIFPDASGNLFLHIKKVPYKINNAGTDISPDANNWVQTDIDLGKQLEDIFRLTTVWDENNVVTFYCDGVELGTYNDVISTVKHSGSSTDYLRFGYLNAYVADKKNGDTYPINLTVSGIVSTDGHVAEADDGDCTTAVKCIECGEDVVPGNPDHTAAPKADTYCTTDTVCVNCGTVMVEGADAHTPNPSYNNCAANHICLIEGCGYVIKAGGTHTRDNEAEDGNCANGVPCADCGELAEDPHTLTPVAKVPATNDTDGMEAHWKCETCDVLYATADGTGGVVDAAALVIPMLAGKVEVEDATVTDAVTNAGEGDVSLDVTDAEYNTSSVQMSNASLLALVNALEQSGKSVIITTDEGVVTVDAAALDAIQTAVGVAENMAIKVKQEANSVLSETQKNALAAYPTLRTVVKAELLVAGTETPVNFGGGTVTVKIPFTPGLGVAGSAYKLVYVSDEGQTEEVTTTYETGYLTATLGHFSDYAIVSEQAETEIIEDTIDRDGGSATQSVYGTYKAADDATVFSVDVNWGSLNFTYQAEVKGTWNAATHQYDNAIAEGWLDNDEAYVEVVNHSNVAINVAVTKNAEEIIADVGVTLTNTDYTLASGTTTTFATAASNKTTIEPYGTLTEEHNNEKIAEITVTITEANA